jgi:hypothetical protein
MHYIDYTPGTIARITDYPTLHGHSDINLLSRLVSSFNHRIKTEFQSKPLLPLSSAEKQKLFNQTFSPYALPKPHPSR